MKHWGPYLGHCFGFIGCRGLYYEQLSSVHYGQYSWKWKMQKVSSNSTTWDTSTYHYVSKLKGCRLRGCSNLLHHIFDKNTFCIIYHKKDQSISFNFCKDNAQKANICFFILSPRGIKLIYCTRNQLDQDIHIIIYCSPNFISLCQPSAKKMNGYCCLTKRPTNRQKDRSKTLFNTRFGARVYCFTFVCWSVWRMFVRNQWYITQQLLTADSWNFKTIFV